MAIAVYRGRIKRENKNSNRDIPPLLVAPVGTIDKTPNASNVLSRLHMCLTLKAPNKIAADDTLFFYFYLSKEIRLDVSCESSA